MKYAWWNILIGRNSRQGLWSVPLLLAVLGCIWLSFQTRDFFSAGNLLNLLSQALPLIIASMGQMVVVLLGGLDLSVGSVISLTTVILAADAPSYVVVPGVFVAAVVIGCANGFAVTRLNVNPIIATLSMQMLVEGLARLIRPVAGGQIPWLVTHAVNGSVFGIPTSIIWMAIVAIAGWKLLYGSRFGFHLFAVGGGVAAGREDAAHTFGIADKRTILTAYILCSVFAALAGVFLAGRIVSGDPNLGPPFALDSITAVALGGTQLAGGIGSLHGTVISAFAMALLANGMNLMNVSAFMQTGIKGAILLLVVAMQTRKKMGL